MTSSLLLTPQGLEKLKAELVYLKKEKRVEVAERIRVAKDYGDLSENAEYHEANDEQAFVEGRISELEQIIKSARVVEQAQESGTVGIGSTVVVSRGGNTMTFQIVGATESDPIQGKISIDSPLGQALTGKKKGDEAKVITPNGELTYTIDTIS